MKTPDWLPLTQSEVDGLPDGTPIVVVWGGNYSANRYRVGRGTDAPSRTYAVDLTGEMCAYIGEGVGPAPLIQVWLDRSKIETSILGKKI